MIYCVIPAALADELHETLLAYYADDPNVTVIVDRRKGDRRGRERAGEATEKRQLRDRRQRPPAARQPHLGGA